MHIQDFPRPKNDNRRGIHWSPSVSHPKGAALDFWISELQAMGMKWVKLLDDGCGSSLELCQRLLAIDVMPIVRLYRLEPNPGHIEARELETARVLISAGVRYFETNNEPNLPSEWKNNRLPSNWLDVAIDNFIYDADRIIELGGLPSLPAMGLSDHDRPLAAVVNRGRADLFEKGAWIAIHNYTQNRPLDYPYDPVNQEGAPVAQEEFERLGPWCWDNRTREAVNQSRKADKKPGAARVDEAGCFLAFQRIDEQVAQALGFQVPMIATEGGPVIGARDDPRYPRLDPRSHAEWVVATNEFLQGGREIHGAHCPPNYFALCHWLLANYRLGFMAPGWESQSWYTDWWSTDFGLQGTLPVVSAVKAMPSVPLEQGSQAAVTGRLVRADTREPLPNLKVNLLAGERVITGTTSAADGTFRLERVATGLYDIAVVPWGTVRRGVEAAIGPAHSVSVALAGGPQGGSTLTGSITGASGLPLAGAHVTLSRDGMVVGECDAAADGTFRFVSLPLGVYTVALRTITVAGIALDGWATRTLKLTSGAAPQGLRYTVVKQRSLPPDEVAGRRIICGTVTDAAGKPLNGITIRMSWELTGPEPEFPILVTGSDPHKPAGTYEFVNTAGVFSLKVLAGDWPSDAAEKLDMTAASGRSGQPAAYEVNFQLRPPQLLGKLDGSVPGGTPGTECKLSSTTGAMTATLGSDGSLAFSDLAPGDYRLEMAGIGVISDHIRLESGSLFKLVFPLRSSIRGTLLAPPAGLIAVLYAPQAWGWTRQTPIATDGTFSFGGLPPGRYRLQISDRVLRDLVLTGENTLQLVTIDLAQGRRSTVRGRVANRSGEPEPGILLTVRRDRLMVAQVTTGEDGSYRFANLPAGTYALEATGMGEVATGIAVDGQREQVHDVLWGTAGPRGMLGGRVLSAAGMPQPRLVVRLFRDGAETARTQTDNSGAFRFWEVPGGVCSLAVGDGAPLVADIRLEDEAALTRDIILPAGPRRLLAHYLLFGTPPSSPQVRVALSLAVPYLCRTGATGGFSVAEAAQASEVTIVGDAVPTAVEETLRAAGCDVKRLTGDGYALSVAFDQLIAKTGEG